VIIVNDGSTDNGVETIKTFSSDPRIRILHQKNKGVSVARNRGVLESKYEFIAFLDGDDEWLPEYLATLKKAIDLYPNAGMYCCAGKIRNKEGTYSRIAKKYEGKIKQINYFENPHVFTHTSSTIVSTKAFNKTQGFPPGMKLNEDYALFYSIALIAPVIYCGFSLSIYVGDVEGQITQSFAENGLNKEKYVLHRINLCNANWLNSGRNNKLYPVFEKYEIRGFFLGYLKGERYDTIHYFLSHFSPSVLENLSTFEMWLYQKKTLKNLAIFYIYYTKLIWRSNGYPRLSYKTPDEN
jgi:glycosyltransferase involved in cell wall biosynthesis